MKLYFDTNIYNFIAACDESHTVRRFLDSSGHKVQASSGNLFEIYAIPDSSTRRTEISTVVTVASSFEPKPQSWLHAYEVRREIGRCRPHWLKRISFTKQAQQLLKGHLQTWQEARTLNLPPAHAYAIYQRDFEGGISGQRQFQKTLREHRLRGRSALQLLQLTKPTETAVVSDADFRDPEMYWRADCLMAWYQALVARSPASRDYADWLDPYVKEAAFNDPTYTRFWLQDVRAENVPRNRLVSLVTYYQMHHKIAHGNAEDQIHAGNLLDVDLFFTADRAYYAVLLEVVNRHFTGIARPLLLDRRAPSALGALSAALSAT